MILLFREWFESRSAATVHPEVKRWLDSADKLKQTIEKLKAVLKDKESKKPAKPETKKAEKKPDVKPEVKEKEPVKAEPKKPDIKKPEVKKPVVKPEIKKPEPSKHREPENIRKPPTKVIKKVDDEGDDEQ